jgi:hypothetical protein
MSAEVESIQHSMKHISRSSSANPWNLRSRNINILFHIVHYWDMCETRNIPELAHVYE